MRLDARSLGGPWHGRRRRPRCGASSPLRSQRAYRFGGPSGDGSSGRFLQRGRNAVVTGAECTLMLRTLRGAGVGFRAVDDNLMKLELKLGRGFLRLQLRAVF